MTKSAITVITAVATLASGCGNGGDARLRVSVRTDLVPAIEFTTVTTVAVGAGRDASVEIERDADTLTGVEVAVFEDLAKRTHELRVTLLDADGREVASRQVRVELRGDLDIVVVFTRDCAGVTCPADGDDPRLTSCLAGRCVDPECTDGTGPACTGREACSGDDACIPVADCATGACVDGVCLARENPTACAPDEYCDPDVGCELDPLEHPVDRLPDAGPPPGVDAGAPDDAGEGDAGEGDAGEGDAGAADAGAMDAGTMDAGTMDAGRTDAGRTDAGMADAGRADAGRPDAGTMDAGRTDSGRPDAGRVDAGRTDAGRTDAGAMDAGPCDLECGDVNGDGAVTVLDALIAAQAAAGTRMLTACEREAADVFPDATGGDGVVTNDDAELLSEIAAGTTMGPAVCEDCPYECGDADLDGDVDGDDARLLSEVAAGLSTLEGCAFRMGDVHPAGARNGRIDVLDALLVQQFVDGVIGSLICRGAPMTTDAGAPDAGMADAGLPDSGRPDAGLPDAGMPDAGMPDAGPCDLTCGDVNGDGSITVLDSLLASQHAAGTRVLTPCQHEAADVWPDATGGDGAVTDADAELIADIAAGDALGPLVCEDCPYDCGDADLDGDVDDDDAQLLADVAAGIGTLEGCAFRMGDVHPAGARNGRITVLDSLLVSQFVDGLIPALTCR